MKKIFTAFAFFLFLYGCGNNDKTANSITAKADDSAIGKIEIYNSRANNIIDSNATIEVIGQGFNWTEGPLWVEAENMLLFSDVPENKIYQWKEGDSIKVYLTPSGYTGSVVLEGAEVGSNGLALGRDGDLLLCQSGSRQVARLNASIKTPKPSFTVLAANYKGKRFNSPNDLVEDSKGNIYFTDPIYGLPNGENDSTRELPFEGVYKISADGNITLLIDSIRRPNGIAFSSDEKTLYVASSDDLHPKWFVYTLDGQGNIQYGRVLLDGTEMKAKATVKQGADGFKIDKEGNIFSAGPDGINIISPHGELLALIKIYNRPTSNCAFTPKKDILYVTADDLVLRVTLHKQ